MKRVPVFALASISTVVQMTPFPLEPPRQNP